MPKKFALLQNKDENYSRGSLARFVSPILGLPALTIAQKLKSRRGVLFDDLSLSDAENCSKSLSTVGFGTSVAPSDEIPPPPPATSFKFAESNASVLVARTLKGETVRIDSATMVGTGLILGSSNREVFEEDIEPSATESFDIHRIVKAEGGNRNGSPVIENSRLSISLLPEVNLDEFKLARGRPPEKSFRAGKDYQFFIDVHLRTPAPRVLRFSEETLILEGSHLAATSVERFFQLAHILSVEMNIPSSPAILNMLKDSRSDRFVFRSAAEYREYTRWALFMFASSKA
ncbi:MAG: hypothetical protein NUW37_04630 [Planctomycetes bacterium]|nr:hypothetical protein [Planctomycetota bacterium]